MPRGLLINSDAYVADWAFKTTNRVPVLVDRAIGVVDKGQLVGAALFTSYNSANAELSYYGRNTISLGIVRALARIALYELRLARCTVIVPKRPAYLLRKLPKFGFRYEGVQHRFYGHTNHPRHTGCRFVAFKEDIEKLLSDRIERVA